MDRRLNSWEQLTNSNNTPDTLRLIANTAYNEIGQLKFKNLHSKDSVNYLQQISYGYNERGWLTNSFAPLFAMTLYYNTNTGNKAYNGNIMYQYWGVPGNLSNPLNSGASVGSWPVRLRPDSGASVGSLPLNIEKNMNSYKDFLQKKGRQLAEINPIQARVSAAGLCGCSTRAPLTGSPL